MGRMANVHPLPKTQVSKPKPASWRLALAAATDEAERMLPAGLQGGASLDSVLERAKGVLARIKRGLGPMHDPRADTPAEAAARARPGVLRRAARVIAEGASKAAAFAGQVKDDIVKDLKKLASDAWQVAAAPLLIGLALFMLNDNKKGSDDSLLLAGALYLASRVL